MRVYYLPCLLNSKLYILHKQTTNPKYPSILLIFLSLSEDSNIFVSWYKFEQIRSNFRNMWHVLYFVFLLLHNLPFVILTEQSIFDLILLPEFWSQRSVNGSGVLESRVRRVNFTLWILTQSLDNNISSW